MGILYFLIYNADLIIVAIVGLPLIIATIKANEVNKDALFMLSFLVCVLGFFAIKFDHQYFEMVLFKWVGIGVVLILLIYYIKLRRAKAKIDESCKARHISM